MLAARCRSIRLSPSTRERAPDRSPGRLGGLPEVVVAPPGLRCPYKDVTPKQGCGWERPQYRPNLSVENRDASHRARGLSPSLHERGRDGGVRWRLGAIDPGG